MSRYAVTGGAGRLGRSVVTSLLEAGHDVTSFDLVDDAQLQAKQVIINLQDPGETNAAFCRLKPDAIIHLAAIATPFSRPDPEIYSINTSITYNVINAAVACSAEALLVASSPTTIGYGNPGGWLPHTLPLNEEHPLEPWHGYAASKVAMENLVAMAVRQFGNQLRLGIFRPCYVISPEEWLGAATQQGHTVLERLADPDLSAVALFNYVDARDVGEFVKAWLLAKDGVPNGTCFFVGAADSLAHAPMSELLPKYLTGLGDMASELSDTQPVFDSSLAERLLGWTAKRSWRTELAHTTL